MSNNPQSDASEKGISEWKCPYCDQTRQILNDLQEHITESTDSNHCGIDGLRPTKDIVAYGPNGEVVDRVDGVSTTPPDPIDAYDKREIIVNAWVAADRDPDRQIVQSISGASQQYVARLINDLNSGEIAHETWIEVLDYGLRDELKERFNEYRPTRKHDSMSTQSKTSDIIGESSKKNRIIAAYKIDPTVDKKAAANALDVSYEYLRQIFKDIEDRKRSEWQKLREGDLEEEPAGELMEAVETRLQEIGAGKTSDEERGKPQQAGSASDSNAVTAEDIQAVQEKMELLLEQAEYTENPNAEFVAQKGIQWLEMLLESAE